MLKELAIITITVSNLATVETAWQESLEYRVSDRGAISAELAALWQAPGAAGSDYIIMTPANEPNVFIRFVEQSTMGSYQPMTSHGWNATELLVRDTDATAARLRDSDFEIVGEPRDLWPAPDAPRAMQAIGPGNELLYLTTNGQATQALGLGSAMPLVERPFIMVLGGPSMEAFEAFYGDTLGMQMDEPSPFRITMISRANDLPMDTTYPLAIGYAGPGYLIEFDELPASIGPRAYPADSLPPGVAAVGFRADPGNAELKWATPPRVLHEFPYEGRAVGMLRGPAGEMVELLLPE